MNSNPFTRFNPTLYLLIFCLIASCLLTPSFASPSLAISPQPGNSVVITWPSALSYVLQTNNNLGPTNWGAYQGTVTQSNGTNSVVIQPLTSSQFFSLRLSTTAGASGPTSIPGLAYYWNFNDLPVSNAVTSWPDRISGLALKQTANPAPTNQNIGVFFDSTPNPLTNAPIQIGSNFTFWVVYRPNTNAGITTTLSLFGNTNGSGLVLNDGATLQGAWGSKNATSSAALAGSVLYPATIDGNLPTPAITYDIVDSGGTLYTNGTPLSQGVAQPTNNFPFRILGNNTATCNLEGCIQYIGIWTNTLLTASQIAYLDNWVNTNGVTNVTSGLLAWYRFNTGKGSKFFDSSGNGFNGYIVGNTNFWTNSFSSAVGGAFYFGQNTYLVTTNFSTNMPAWCVTFWVNGNTFNALSANAAAFLSQQSPSGGGGWAVYADSANNCFGGVYGLQGGFYEGGRPLIEQFDNTWHFIAINFTTTNTFTWLDGAFFAPYPNNQGPVTSIANTGYLNIGNDTFGAYLSGAKLSDIRIYNRQLTPQEIAILYRWRGQP